METLNNFHSLDFHISQKENKYQRCDDFDSLNNANIENSSCNDHFNVSLGIHVQNIDINQTPLHELDLCSLIRPKKKV